MSSEQQEVTREAPASAPAPPAPSAPTPPPAEGADKGKGKGKGKPKPKGKGKANTDAHESAAGPAATAPGEAGNQQGVQPSAPVDPEVQARREAKAAAKREKLRLKREEIKKAKKAAKENGERTATSSIPQAQGGSKDSAQDSTAARDGAAKAKKSKAKKPRSRKKKDAEGGGRTSRADTKVRLKVVVRQLPAALPEHLFWATVLPWVRTQAQVEAAQNVLKGDNATSQPEPQKQSQPAPTPSTTDAPTTPEPSADASAPTTQNNEPSKVDAEPPALKPKPVEPAIVAAKDAAAQPYSEIDIDSHTAKWISYVPGKQRQAGGAKPTVPSRAYIRFTNEEALNAFASAFQGHAFKDSTRGQTSVAQLELAPHQKVAEPLGERKKRQEAQRIGTIDQDPEYLEFLSMLDGKAEADQIQEAESNKTATMTDAQLTASLLAATEAKADEAKAAQDALARSTPLLEHLRMQREKTQKGRDQAGKGKDMVSKGKAKEEDVKAAPTKSKKGKEPQEKQEKPKDTKGKVKAKAVKPAADAALVPPKKKKGGQGPVTAPQPAAPPGKISILKRPDPPSGASSTSTSTSAPNPPAGGACEKKDKSKGKKPSNKGGKKPPAPACGS